MSDSCDQQMLSPTRPSKQTSLSASRGLSGPSLGVLMEWMFLRAEAAPLGPYYVNDALSAWREHLRALLNDQSLREGSFRRRSWSFGSRTICVCLLNEGRESVSINMCIWDRSDLWLVSPRLDVRDGERDVRYGAEFSEVLQKHKHSHSRLVWSHAWHTGWDQVCRRR